MKRQRHEETDESIHPIYSLDLRMVFSDSLLQRLATKLNDKDLSSAARSCKLLMRLTYFRIAEVLEWGQPKPFIISYSMEPMIKFPNDQFLQMQAAKTVVFSDQNIDPLDINELQVQSVRNILRNPEDRDKIEYLFTLNFYMKEICFTPAQDLAMRNENKIVRTNPLFLPRKIIDALSIICRTDSAKCRYAVLNNEFEKYKALRTIGAQFDLLDLMLNLSKNVEFDPRFLIFEIEWLGKADHWNMIESAIEDVAAMKSKYYPFENPIIFQYLRRKKLMPKQTFIYTLVYEQHNGVQRCKRMMELGCIDEYDILKVLEKEESSFLYSGLDPDDEDSVRNYYENTRLHIWSYDIARQITNLLQFDFLRATVLERLTKIVPLLEPIVTRDEDYVKTKTYTELKLLLLNNTA